MATKNTLKNDFFATNCKPVVRRGRPTGFSPKYEAEYRLSFVDENGQKTFLKKTFKYEEAANKLARRLNARAKLSAAGTRASQRNKYTVEFSSF